jgi:membrane protein
MMNLKRDVLPLLKETWDEFQKDEASQLGAALAYYAMFSIFPLLLLLVATLGFVLRYWDQAIDVQQQILAVVEQNFSPQLRDTLGDILTGVKNKAGAATGVGLVTLLIGASGVFQQLDASFNKIWQAPEQPKSSGIVASIMSILRTKLFSFGMVLAVGFLLVVSLALTGITQAVLNGFTYLPVVGSIAGVVLGLAVTLLLNTLVFALLFKYLPNTKVRWRDVWLGAFVTALIWEAGKRLLAIYIGYSSYASAYGVVGTVLVLMAWIYFSSQILFLGAEFTEVYSRRHGSRSPQPAPASPTEPVHPPLTAQPAASAPVARPLAPASGKVAMMTGAGLLLGVLGGAVAGIAALLIGARRAVAPLTRRFKRSTH